MLMEGCFSSVPIPIPMGKTIKIIRNSIHTFLQHYHYFTTTATLAALPFSVAVLISQLLSPSLSLLPTISARLHSLFYAAGFPPSSEFFSILSLKLSQTITSSILTLPFTLSFLLFAKAFVIRKLKNPRKHGPVSSLFIPLVRTQVCNSLVIISANATCFWLALIAFNCLENLNLPPSATMTLFFSAVVAVAYSVVLANALIICNMALVLSGMERSGGGIISVLKACVLIRGRTSTALSLALPVNIALAATEALFHYRVARAYSDASGEIGINLHTLAMVLEGLLIGYLYSILVTIDTITSCVFLKSCEVTSSCGVDHGDQESRHVYRFEIKSEGENEEDGGGNGSTFANVKISVKELP